MNECVLEFNIIYIFSYLLFTYPRIFNRCLMHNRSVYFSRLQDILMHSVVFAVFVKF